MKPAGGMMVEAATRIHCSSCGIPPDSQHFDVSEGILRAPEGGQDRILARFDLRPRYCGILEYFAQFTDHHTKDPSRIGTPGLVWRILQDGRPLSPYVGFQWILNPWGNGAFPVSVRLEEGATIQFVVRNQGNDEGVTKVAGRLLGRYWYNPAYGDVLTRKG